MKSYSRFLLQIVYLCANHNLRDSTRLNSMLPRLLKLKSSALQWRRCFSSSGAAPLSLLRLSSSDHLRLHRHAQDLATQAAAASRHQRLDSLFSCAFFMASLSLSLGLGSLQVAHADSNHNQVSFFHGLSLSFSLSTYSYAHALDTCTGSRPIEH
jgi:hypothetical protein